MYQNTAQGIASLGRNNDSMLMHVTPGEVQGLQQLAMSHGGSLTINPQTGLPEAGFLSNILPIAASVIGSMYGMPWLGAAISGGANYLQTGNLGQSIGKGALSYGLGQIGGNMMDAGAENLAMTPGLANVGYEAASNPDVLQSLANAGSSAAPAYSPDPFGPAHLHIPEASSSFGANTYNPYAYEDRMGLDQPGQPEVAAPAVAAPAAAPTAPATYPNTPDLREQAAIQEDIANKNPATTNYKSVAQIKSERPWDSFKAGASQAYGKGLGAFLTDNKTPLMVAGAGLLGSSMFATPKGVNAPSVNKGNIRPFKYAPGTPNPRYGLPGEPPLIGQGFTAQPIYPVAAGGLMDLSNEYAAGGRLLQGPGDGMSDSIPAVIKGPKPQRAALAQGEFVIPADVVSHLGNGSTDAGAKRLYSMMDKIRQARTGNKKQGRQINPDKFMPA